MSQRRGGATFLLGVGAQKSGTAWMHRYLESSPQCDPGFRKEYHIWDGLDLPSGRLVRQRIEAQAHRPDAGESERRRWGFYEDPESYFDYFAGLLEAPQVRLTADITPAYALLDSERLRMIRDAMVQRAVRPVTVYLMRDPVERVWSAVRMDIRRKGIEKPGAAEHRLKVMADDDQYAIRTRYDLTMDRLEGAFGRESVFYGFYETLFDRSTLADLCAFLGIDFHEPDLSRQVNVSPKGDGDLSDETMRRVARGFAPVYAAVAARFPSIDLPTLWPSMRYL
ncbi:sulfotransferase [Nocardioides sp.]|uniref:sulfotransferase n=1 Tax=Nocardioides sp. TaxID=35761 RepID=UPI0035682D89